MSSKIQEQRLKNSQQEYYNSRLELGAERVTTMQTPKYFIPHVLEFWNFLNQEYKIKETKPRFLDIGTSSGYLMQAWSHHCSWVVGYERYTPWFKVANKINYDCPRNLYNLDWLEASDTPKHQDIIKN